MRRAPRSFITACYFGEEFRISSPAAIGVTRLHGPARNSTARSAPMPDTLSETTGLRRGLPQGNRRACSNFDTDASVAHSVSRWVSLSLGEASIFPRKSSLRYTAGQMGRGEKGKDRCSFPTRKDRLNPNEHP